MEQVQKQDFMRKPLYLNCFSDLRQRLFYCSGVGHLECGTDEFIPNLEGFFSN